MTDRVALNRMISELQREHAEIFDALFDLSRDAQSVKSTRPDPEMLANLAQQLETLQARLRGHFIKERSVALLETLQQILPHAAPEIARLEEEHREILANVNAARSLTNYCSPEHTSQLVEGVTALMDMMCAHEAGEDNLMEAARNALETGQIPDPYEPKTTIESK